MKQESDFGLIFRAWMKANRRKFESAVFELKDTRGKTYFPLSEWKEAQRTHALACKADTGNLMRFSSGTSGMPDYGFYRNAYAYVVIRYPKVFYIIDASDLLNHKGKSLKKTEAEMISLYSVVL
jgi:hypothetical protein